jgi:hypothetical protein
MPIIYDDFIECQCKLIFNLLELTTCEINPWLQDEDLMIAFVHFLIENLWMSLYVM